MYMCKPHVRRTSPERRDVRPPHRHPDQQRCVQRFVKVGRWETRRTSRRLPSQCIPAPTHNPQCALSTTRSSGTASKIAPGSPPAADPSSKPSHTCRVPRRGHLAHPPSHHRLFCEPCCRTQNHPFGLVRHLSRAEQQPPLYNGRRPTSRVMWTWRAGNYNSSVGAGAG